MANKTDQREQRGQISLEFERPFQVLSDHALMEALHNVSARERNAAAKILGSRRCITAIQPLCQALKMETALYSKISICEALAEIGLPAVPTLIPLLGHIGHNQHSQLPQKGFYKKSYPLPRDIAARILIRIGLPALDALETVLRGDQRKQTLEALDALGHISFNTRTTRSLPVLMPLYHKHAEDDLLKWKILRAFSAFPDQEITNLLEDVVRESACPALRWEAVRSLGLQKRVFRSGFIKMVSSDPNEEIRRMAALFLSRE